MGALSEGLIVLLRKRHGRDRIRDGYLKRADDDLVSNDIDIPVRKDLRGAVTAPS